MSNTYSCPPSRRRPRHATAVVGLLVAGTTLAACGNSTSNSSASASSHVAVLSKAARGTLSEWNWDTVADSPGSNNVLPKAIRLFEQQHPHMSVSNLEMTLGEQNDKLPLAFDSASSAPVVSQTNEGYQSMGRLVADGELMPLTKYASLYHWISRVGNLPLQYNSFTSNGKNFGSGELYGIPWTAGSLGIFYNKALLAKAGAAVPSSWSAFLKDLPLVKKAGYVPIAYGSGQPTAYQPVHVLYTIADMDTPPSVTNNFVFHRGPHPSIDVPGYVHAAETLASWTKDGYFPPGFSGLSDTQALNYFTDRKAAFFIEGEWYISSIQSALGNQAGLWIPPSATGGPGEGWSIPSRSANPNAAAAWINLLLSPKVQAEQLQQGSVPVVAPSAATLAKVGAMSRVAAEGWQQLVKSNRLVPYLDYATPNYLNQLMAAIQELQAGQLAPRTMIRQLQSDYTAYWQSR